MRNILIGILYFISVTLAYGQCYQDRHSNVLTDCWISCETSPSPNILRGNSHWILYEFDGSHIIGTSHFWNINSPGYENMGAQLIAIDYSNDGLEWTEWGTLSLDKAGQTGFYEGEEGPNFQGINAQYILITILESYGEDCRGLAEVRFESLGISTSTENNAFASSQLKLSPNPAYDHTYINLDSYSDFRARISIINSEGKEILLFNENFTSGNNRVRVNFSDLSPGNYVVLIDNGSSRISSQLSIINR